MTNQNGPLSARLKPCPDTSQRRWRDQELLVEEQQVPLSDPNRLRALARDDRDWYQGKVGRRERKTRRSDG